MTLLEDVHDYLLDAGIGVGVYVGTLPDPQPGFVGELAISLYEYPGLAPVWVQPQDQATPATPKYRQPRIQVNARGTKEAYASAEVLANQAYEAIAAIKNMDLASGTRYQSISPIQEPYFLRWDENRRPIFVFNAQAYLTHAA